MANFVATFLALFRKYVLALVPVLGSVFGIPGTGSAIIPNPAACDRMAAAYGLSSMPAGSACTLPHATFMPYDKTFDYSASADITPAAADAWLATLPGGVNLTQQPCWTDQELYPSGCDFTVRLVKKSLVGVKSLDLEIYARHLSEPVGDATVGLRVESDVWGKCSEIPPGSWFGTGAWGIVGRCAQSQPTPYRVEAADPACQALNDRIQSLPSGGPLPQPSTCVQLPVLNPPVHAYYELNAVEGLAWLPQVGATTTTCSAAEAAVHAVCSTITDGSGTLSVRVVASSTATVIVDIVPVG